MKNNLEKFGLGFIIGIVLFGIISILLVSYII